MNFRGAGGSTVMAKNLGLQRFLLSTVLLSIMTTSELVTTTQAITTTAAPTSPDVPTAPPVSVDVAPLTFSGMTVAGGIHMLTCSVTVTGSTDQPIITWLVNNAEIGSDAARIVSMTSGSAGRYSSTLTFNPLAASHVGVYTCRATLGSAVDTTSWAVIVQNPTITVSIASNVAAPMVGSMYSLTCAVTGAERLTDAMVTYTWSKNGTLLSGQTMATLSFSPLTFSDAGSYTCQVTVTSSLLSGPISNISASPVSINNMLPATVSLFLRGRLVTNNSYVDIDDIGEGDDGAALLCVTDLMHCCRGIDTPGLGGALGVWLYPNGTDVLLQESGDDFYRDRGRSVVRLNRRNNAISPTGLYCCEIPDASNTQQRVCANVVLEVPTIRIPEPAMSTYTAPQSPTTTNSGVFRPQPPAEVSCPCACSSEVGIAVGALLLAEGIIAVVTAVIVVYCCLVIRRRKSGKSDFVVSANMAYGQVKLEALGDVGEEYEDPDRLARPGQGGGGSCEPTEHLAPYEFPVSKPEAPVYATADETNTSGKIQPT